jgi:hypothetical protein
MSEKLDEMKEAYEGMRKETSMVSETNDALTEFLGEEMSSIFMRMMATLLLSMMTGEGWMERWVENMVTALKNKGIKIMPLKMDMTADEDCKDGVVKFVEESGHTLSLAMTTVRESTSSANESLTKTAPIFKTVCDRYRIGIPKKEKVKK